MPDTANATPMPINWDLESLYPDHPGERFADLIDEYAADVRSHGEHVAGLPSPTTETAPQWGEAVHRLSEIQARGSSLRSTIGCHAAADAENPLYLQFEAKMAAVSPDWTALTLHFETAFGSLGEDERAAFVAADPRLSESAFFVEEAAATAAFRLPGDLERLNAELAVDGLKAWSRLYDRVSGSLKVKVLEKGRLVEKSPGQVQYDMPDRHERQTNFHAANVAWDTVKETCADALNHIAGARLTKYRRLGVDHLAYPLHLNRLSRESLDAMFAVISERAGLLVPYLDAKAKRLGLEKLTWYDVGAPLVTGAATPKMSWDAAAGTVVETLRDFHAPFGDFSAMALEKRWVESEDRPGKRQGAFCTDLSGHKQTRVFMTFNGTANSMSTLAHELGHAYHTWLLKDEPVLVQDYPMNLAETASTFAEAVVADRRLADAASDGERLEILESQCADAVAFLMNIPARFHFETAFHEQRANGELTAGQITDLMLEAQRSAYHDALDPEELNPLFWASKLHFYIDDWPFYNFPYTFGYLLSLGLYAEGKSDPDGFPEKFDRFLSLTASRSSEDAVREGFGHDLTQRTFWDAAVDEVRRRVDAFLSEVE